MKLLKTLAAVAGTKAARRLKELSFVAPVAALGAVIVGAPVETVNQVAGVAGQLGLDVGGVNGAVQTGMALAAALAYVAGRKENKTIDAERA